MLVHGALQELHVHVISPLDLEVRETVQQHQTYQLEVLDVSHVLYHQSLQVPQPPDTLQTIPVDASAAGDVEVLQGIIELSRDSVHAPLVNMLTVR